MSWVSRRDVEQVVEEARHQLALPADDLHGLAPGRRGRGPVEQQVARVQDGSQRVAQLVREHRQEHVAAHQGLACLGLRALERADVGRDAAHAADLPAAVDEGELGLEERVRAVVALEGLLGLQGEARRDDAQVFRGVRHGHIRGEELGIGLAEELLPRGVLVRRERPVDEQVTPLEVLGEDGRLRILEDRLEQLLALLEGHVHALPLGHVDADADESDGAARPVPVDVGSHHDEPGRADPAPTRNSVSIRFFVPTVPSSALRSSAGRSRRPGRGRPPACRRTWIRRCRRRTRIADRPGTNHPGFPTPRCRSPRPPAPGMSRRSLDSRR